MLFGDGNRIAEVLLKRNGTAFHFCSDLGSDKAQMPGLILVSRDGIFALRITNNESVLMGVLVQPFGFLGAGKTALRRAFARVPGHVDRQSRLMLAVTRTRAVRIRFDAVSLDVVVSVVWRDSER